MLRAKLSFVLIASLVLAVGVSCQRSDPEGEIAQRQTAPPDARKPTGPVLASVNGEIITAGDFEDEIASLPEYTRKQLTSADQKMKRLDNMIKETLLRQEAQRRGLDRDREIQHKVARYRDRLITEKLYQDAARELGTVDENRVRQHYEENLEQFIQQERIRASQILIPVSPNATPEQDAEARVKAENALEKARRGEDFEQLAREYSEGPTAVRGGDLGYFQRGRMVPEFEEVAFSMETVGEVSDIVRTKFGYHIIQLTDRQPETQMPLDEVRERIVRQMESRNRREIRQTLDQNLREKANVVIHEEHIRDDPAGAANQ